MRLPALNPDTHRSRDVRNVLHTWILIGGSALLMALIAWTVYGPPGLVWAAVLGAFGLWSMSRISPKMVLGLYKARPLSPDELPEIQRIIRELAKRADLQGIPQLYHVPSRMLNAFAVGSREDSALAITDGLLRAMNLRQIAGILAHEISHIRAGDLKVMALADVLTRLTNFMSLMGLLGIPAFLGAGIQIPWLGLLLLVLAPTIGGLLQLGLSRSREYDADFEGAALTGDPESLASALQTLERKQGNVWEGLFPAGRIPDPSLLRTHPRTKDRIRRLLSLAPSGTPQIVVAPEKPRPSPSIVPPVRDPRIHWRRMGIWY
jgi:heat shock protein HtpX